VPPSPDLDRAQRIFWDLIAAPTGVGPGAEEMAKAGTLDSSDLSFLIRGDERLGPAERLDIYADMYFYRLRDSLAEDFAKVAAIAGGDRFHNLVTDYLLVHPSSHWSMRDLGKALPAYLEGHPLREEFPYLADLARLEWARIDVFDEADAAPLTRAEITGIPQEEIADLRLRLVPACRLLALDWNVAPVWRRLEEMEEGSEPGGINSASVEAPEEGEAHEAVTIDPPERRCVTLRVWRKGFHVLHRGTRPDEHACLAGMEPGGASLPRIGEVILDHLEGQGSGGEDAAQSAARRIAALIETWIEDGIVRAFGSTKL
jgi:hypothetical protein